MKAKPLSVPPLLQPVTGRKRAGAAARAGTGSARRAGAGIGRGRRAMTVDAARAAIDAAVAARSAGAAAPAARSAEAATGPSCKSFSP